MKCTRTNGSTSCDGPICFRMVSRTRERGDALKTSFLPVILLPTTRTRTRMKTTTTKGEEEEEHHRLTLINFCICSLVRWRKRTTWRRKWSGREWWRRRTRLRGGEKRRRRKKKKKKKERVMIVMGIGSTTGTRTTSSQIGGGAR